MILNKETEVSEETKEEKKTLTLGNKLGLKKPGEGGLVKQSFSHGRSKIVEVKVKKRRSSQKELQPNADQGDGNVSLSEEYGIGLKQEEIANRIKVVQRALQEEAKKHDISIEEEKNDQEQQAVDSNIEPDTGIELEQTVVEDSITPTADYETKEETVKTTIDHSVILSDFVIAKPTVTKTTQAPVSHKAKSITDEDDDDAAAKKKSSSQVKQDNRRLSLAARRNQEQPRKLDRQSIDRALNDEISEKVRSLASMKRAKQKHFRQVQLDDSSKIIREVIIPEMISVGELANRMAVRGADVVKALMKSGMLVTINQMIDADTAELLCVEFGHKVKRISEWDVELGLSGDEDLHESLLPRPPVVTIMGHVDHGKTSLLDALRETDVVSGEAGGITQHIGAYQVTIKSGHKITFIDTPGHEAFTEMRARGANLTDIVILVVAADDGIKEQTVEAINHIKAANVPMIVAINKIDKPGADASRVRSELLNHGILLEEFGGEVMAVEVSAKQKLNLEKLEEIILIQAEILGLKANPSRDASGVVIEAKVDKGRGTVATVLVQKGTLKVGDILVAGHEWGRVRALVNDHGMKIEDAVPSLPVEILGFNSAPKAGDEFYVVDSESRAREIAENRARISRDAKVALAAKSSMENMMSRIASGEQKFLPVLIKADVQGSLEAISTSLSKLSNEEVSVRVLHGAVGGINEGDISLAKASGGIVVGFNVRANVQARDIARRDGVDIRYYSIIYNVVDDIKAMLSGLLSPTIREKYLGNAEIRQVFNISNIGKIAGCYVTEGTVKRGAKVRLLRDNVVIHEGTLKTLRRFKEEVKEVKESFECGMAFENYNDIREGDVIECFELESIARVL